MSITITNGARRFFIAAIATGAAGVMGIRGTVHLNPTAHLFGRLIVQTGSNLYSLRQCIGFDFWDYRES